MFLSAALSALVFIQADRPRAFEFKDGDRIVWLGSTLVEREQRYGYWETALLAANADNRITVRNLGWSGDTVFGESRGRFNFNDPSFCFKQIVDQTLALKPTVIFICYGTNESFEGKDGLPKFEKGLEKLLDALKPARARIVLFSPIPFEAGPQMPRASDCNAVLQSYIEVARRVAAERKLYFADLYSTVQKRFDEIKRLREAKAIRDEYLTQNGMHLTEDGYHGTSICFLQSLGLIGQLPSCDVGFEPPVALKRLKNDLEPLRKAVVAKNELFFHRWRPENETYLFGFRKHEQGKNAKEVAEFDPLVAKAEEEIERIRKTLTK